MIYYDTRRNEWVKDLDTDFLAPECYYTIKPSDDGKSYHEFMTRNGIVKFCSTNDKEFQEQYKKIKKDVLYRKSWTVPRDFYEGGLKYFGIKE